MKTSQGKQQNGIQDSTTSTYTLKSRGESLVNFELTLLLVCFDSSLPESWNQHQKYQHLHGS